MGCLGCRLAEFKLSKSTDMKRKNDLLKRVLIFSYIFKCVVATVVVVIVNSEFLPELTLVWERST